VRWLGAGALAVVGFFVGVFVNLLVDRVPAKRPLRPLGGGCRRCLPEAAYRPPPGDPSEVDDEVDAGMEVDADVEARAAEQAAAEQAAAAHAEAAAGPPVGALLWPGGRCRTCRRGPSPRYAVVQVLTAAAFAAVALRFGADWALPAYLVFFTALLAVSAIDLELNIIPNRIVYPTIFVSVPLLAAAALAEADADRLGEALIGAAAAWAALLVIHLISPAGMGFGDVRLAFVLGLFLGWLGLRLVLIGLFLGFLLGAVLGALMILVGRRGRRDHIPFGPFLAGGAALAVFFGDPFSSWWLGA